MIGAPKLRLRGRPKGIIVWSGGGETVPPGPPTDITWAGSHAVPEDASIGTFVGSFVTVTGGIGTVTLSMLDSASGRFAISGGNRVVVAGALDYDLATSHDITIRATDSPLNVYDEVFTVTVTNVTVPISDIAWAGSHTVAENASIGTVVGGLLSATGGEGAITFTLTDSAGGKFAVSGSNIVTAAALDYETATSHSITVRATDTAAQTYDEVFSITVTDIADTPPTDIIWAGTHTVAENASVGTAVGGALSASGGSGPYTFTLTDSAGGKFAVDGTAIEVAGALDYETATSHNITVRATNAAGTYDEVFAITVTDVSEGGIVAYKSQGTYLAYANRSDSTLAKPSSVASGDFLLAFIAYGRGAMPDLAVAPSGWTEVGSTTTSMAGFNVRFTVWSKVATGSEPTSYTFTHSDGSANSCGMIVAYSNVDTSDPFNIAPALTEGAGASVVATGVTTTVPNTFIVFAEHDWGSNTTNFGPPSQAPDERVDDIIVYISDGTIASVGATGTFDHTCNSDDANPWGAFVIPLKSV